MNSDENCDVNAQHARQTDDIFGTVCGGWGLIKILRVIRQCAPTAETQEYVKGIVSLFLTLIPVAFPTYFLSLSLSPSWPTHCAASSLAEASVDIIEKTGHGRFSRYDFQGYLMSCCR